MVSVHSTVTKTPSIFHLNTGVSWETDTSHEIQQHLSCIPPLSD